MQLLPRGYFRPDQLGAQIPAVQYYYAPSSFTTAKQAPPAAATSSEAQPHLHPQPQLQPVFSSALIRPAGFARPPQNFLPPHATNLPRPALGITSRPPGTTQGKAGDASGHPPSPPQPPSHPPLSPLSSVSEGCNLVMQGALYPYLRWAVIIPEGYSAIEQKL